jgi:hypothetical protein
MTPYDHHPGADWRTPLRFVVCLPVRLDDGTWFGVPMYQLPVEDAEDIKRAERIAVERYRKKIARVA